MTTVELGIESDDLDRQIQKLQDYDRIHNKRFQKAMRQATLVMKVGWQRVAPVLTRKYVLSIADRVEIKGGEVIGIIGTDVVSERGFPYPAALEEGDQYHYRRTPQRGQQTKGQVKRMAEARRKQTDSIFKKAADQVTQDMVVR